MPRPANVLRLLICLALCFGAAGWGLHEAAVNRRWLQTLARPSFSPAETAFIGGWALFYLLIALAAFGVWRRVIPPEKVRLALGAFVFQWLLNGLWFYLFFGRRELIAAFEIIIFFWFAVALALLCTARVSRPAALLLLPCLAWIGYLAAVNGALIRLNFGGHVG